MQPLSENGFILKFSLNHSRKETVERFTQLGIPRSRVFRVLKKGTNVRKPRSDKGKRKFDSKRIYSAVRSLHLKVGRSYRKQARSYSMSTTSLFRYAKRAGTVYRKRTKAPKVSEKQKNTQAERLPRLLALIKQRVKSLRCDTITDDESYFTLDGSEMPENVGYHCDVSTNRKDIPVDVRTRPMSKFPTKVLVWAAISSKGISPILIAPSKSISIDAQTYTKACLKKNLLPFLKRHYPRNNYLFWPDLASAHYASTTQKFLGENKIRYVPKDANPPNAPVLRPIENFWGALKQKVYKGGWEAVNVDQLATRIRYCAGQMDKSVYTKMMKRIQSKCEQAISEGLDSLY